MLRKWPYIIAAFTLVLFTVIIFTYEEPFVVQFDGAMNQLFFGNSFIEFFHIFGETKMIVIISLILILSLWFRHRNYRGMLFVVLAVGVGNGLNQLIKTLIARPRPEMVDQLTSFSLPSGHAMIGLLYLFTIAYILSEILNSRKTAVAIWIIALILVILTGLSRVSGSHHYATDIIAGWCIGFTWFMIVVYWYESRKRKINQLKTKESSL
ncbi:Undecaprenyl-diphosphatase OS=Ureibacillus acetophenoni OX=614649 GN=SAMN05877842_111107 PE=4 SV=1 [Ureibacillus acetophenoni]